jgi:hypothetical protein
MTGRKKINSLSAVASGAAPRRARTLAAALAAPAPLAACTADVEVASNAAPLPPLHPVAQAVAVPSVRPTGEAVVTGPERTPTSRISESRRPVDEPDARACRLVPKAQVADAIVAYREASQRGHAPSSHRLMEFHVDGAPGAARDDRVAVFFKERAVQQGASIDPAWRR